MLCHPLMKGPDAGDAGSFQIFWISNFSYYRGNVLQNIVACDECFFMRVLATAHNMQSPQHQLGSTYVIAAGARPMTPCLVTRTSQMSSAACA